MKTIVMWLLGVPVAVSLMFVVFAVDAGKLSSRMERPEVSDKFVVAADRSTNAAALRQSAGR